MSNEKEIITPMSLVHELELSDGRRYRVLDTGKPYAEGYPEDNEGVFLTANTGFMIQAYLPKSFPDSAWRYVSTARTIDEALLTIGMFDHTRNMEKIKAMIVPPEKPKKLPPRETEHQVYLGMQMLLNDYVSSYVIYEKTIYPDITTNPDGSTTEESSIVWRYRLALAKLNTLDDLRKKFPDLIFTEKEDRMFEDIDFKGQPAKRLTAVTITVSIKRKPTLEVVKDRIITDATTVDFYQDVVSFLLDYINDPELTDLVQNTAPDA